MIFNRCKLSLDKKGFGLSIGFVAILGNKAHLGIFNFSVVVCTDSYSLYEYIVKLGTIKEKRLIIDIIAIRELYERRELFKVRWIGGKSNPADAMTKIGANISLQKLVLTNTLKVQVDG
ncbi:polyprotein [Drepanopeziza brunnea f. sp. 'multigermtubi' MB_m1]|uniref:Polyprotein n=1 Tax=Marssonina brunnea f. sp. multigermtubi (strain MB_m1) TaxID=1072389 RepID=K1WXT7_MARBU|nr:polyprotein [Drepanopeziza brunnea f. sp. 'multigermtubi' MB_m1]EKD13458.1 polyprotein [Drepanopeziza brunnea f. sp. 'multigermtubi' MB_m1]